MHTKVLFMYNFQETYADQGGDNLIYSPYMALQLM